ncbi:DUF6585 family protein [Streptomyces sp. NPDC088729]|uniref:DUF6585 family protein n=1 Tax=unclassified Streptomyces TaxID=2593676 RepID=UPI000F54F6AE|nr:DUF6585 family protein [Streptomyces sp. ADI96-02]
MPPAIREAARDFELGRRRGLVHTEPRRLVWPVLIPLVVFGAAMLWFGASSAVEDQRTSGAWYYSSPLLVLGLGPLALAAWIFARAWTQPQIWVAHYERGLVRWITGRVPEVYEWDEIAGIAREETRVTDGLSSATWRTLTVIPEEGDPIVVSDSYSGLAAFADALDTAFSRVRLLQDAARLEAGEQVDFFLVQLDPTGIGHLGEHLAWREVARVEVKKGILDIHRLGVRKPWLSIPASSVRNLRVFLSLAEALRRQHRSR